jgi:hypothetical protein
MEWENNMANIYGNFIWWQGVVEDIMDPLMIGRCKVRILGYHTDDKTEGSGIPTEHLPWATPMQPITSAAISGIGTTPLGPVEGTWVVGFFRDGEDAQEPVIMGTVGGIPEEGPDPEKGFNDPYGMYPLDSHLADEHREVPEGSHNYIPKENEPDTNRLARGNFVIPTKNSKCLTDEEVPLSNGENSESLKWKRKTRQEAVPKALAGNLSSSIDNTNEKIYATNVGGVTSNLEANLDTMSVSSLNIIDGGSGYTTAPTVTFSGYDTGATFLSASATAIIDSGVVTGFEDLIGGNNYTATPTVTLSAPPEGGTQATATANVTGEDVSGIVSDKEKDPATYADDENYYWNEPHPRYGGVKKSKTEFATEYSSCYPYNKVRQSESGHVEEWDDTPGAERLHRYHGSGTFEEIQADGTRVVKVLGNDYEIVADDKNVLVSGACNVTVEGDCRLLTMGSLVQEVRGNYHLNVAQDMRIKVGGNMVQEIMSARKIKVEKDDDLKVGKDQIMNIGINAKKQIGKDYSVVAGGAFSTTSGANTSITADTSVFIDAILNTDISAGAIASMGGGIDVNITATALINVTCPVGIINIIAMDVNVLGEAMVHVASPFINLLSIGLINADGPVIHEASLGHFVESGIYMATCGLIELN